MPHLAVYFVVDCSGTMSLDDKMASVKRGVVRICETLSSDPRSATTIMASVIWFNDTAGRTPLVPITAFRLPDTLQPLGKTALGAALDELNRALDADLAPGDYRPLVFLLTDGQPTDSWEPAAERYRARTSGAPQHTIGLAIGGDAKVEMIAAIADPVMEISNVTPKALEDYFDWVTDSVTAVERYQTVSRLVDPWRTVVLPPVPKTVALRRDVTGVFQVRPPDQGNPEG